MAPHQHLAKRAQITVNGAAGIVLIVLLVVGTLFCIVTVLLICKRKRARKQNQLKLANRQESQPFVTPQPQPYVAQEYRMPETHVEMEAKPRGPMELQGVVVDDASRRQPQQIDGFVAPATTAYTGKPVEMAAQSPAR